MDCDINTSKYRCLGLSGYPASSFFQGLQFFTQVLPLNFDDDFVCHSAVHLARIDMLDEVLGAC